MNQFQIKRVVVGDFSRMRIARSMILILLSVYLGLFFYAYFYADRIAFQPPSSTYQENEQIIKIAVDGGVQLSAVYLHNPTAFYTILFTHGNAEDLGLVLPFLLELRKAGFSIFSFDYRGYGTSTGVPGEATGYTDTETVYRYMTEELKISEKRIIAHGRSLGGTFAIHLASKRPLAGLIIESSFTTGFRVLTQIPIFPLDRFHNLSKLKDIHCPILFIHGKRDSVIRFTHGESLYQAAKPPKDFLWIDEAGHNNLFHLARQAYLQKLNDFSIMVKNEALSKSQ